MPAGVDGVPCLQAYSNVQAAEDAPLDAKGVPTAATNLSLGFTDLKGSIPVKILDKMMVLLSDKQASNPHYQRPAGPWSTRE